MAVATLYGPGHVIDHLDDGIAPLFAGAVVGQPAAEFVLDRDLLRAIDDAYHGGQDWTLTSAARGVVWVFRSKTDESYVCVHAETYE